MSATATIHATCVAMNGRGVLLLGASGAGKSDLALRLIDRGAVLISDDYTVLTRRDDALFARPPATIAGRMEVRGVGIVALPHRSDVPVVLAVTLGEESERMPEPRSMTIAETSLPALTIDPRWPSAAIKLEWALARMTEEAGT